MKDDLSPRGGARGRFRIGLVISQVAVSLLLLVGAGLVARSLDAARSADAGFDGTGVISTSIDVTPMATTSRGPRVLQRVAGAARADSGIDVGDAGDGPAADDGRSGATEGHDRRLRAPS